MTIEKFREFAAAVESRITINASHADNCMDNLRLSLVWTARHMESCSSTPFNVLLKGCYGAAVEAVSLVSFGLVRPAMLSLRSHYELSLQYLYYRDHPVEWRSVAEFRAQPILPGSVKKYLKENYPRFERRFRRLLAVRTRADEDCYRVLSGIAHGAAINSISTASEPADLVESEEIVSQSVAVFHGVGEHIRDVFVASFEGNWLSLPEGTKSDLESRFEASARRKLEF